MTPPPPNTTEESLSCLSYAAGTLDKQPTLTPDELHRLRQLLIRLSNTERRFTKESEK